MKYQSRTQELKPTALAEDDSARETGEAEAAGVTEDDRLLAVRARPLRFPEGAGDTGGAGGSGGGADGPVAVNNHVAVRGGTRPVGPGPDATERKEDIGGGDLGRDDGGQAAEVGFVGAVGLVCAAAIDAVDGVRAGGERRDGDGEEEEPGLLHSGGW